MENALQGLFERDVELADEVIEGDQEMDLLEVKVDSGTLLRCSRSTNPWL